MKKLFIFLVLMASVSMLKSQSWVSSNGLFSDEDVNTVNSAITSDGSVVVLGYFKGNIHTPAGETIVSYGDRDYFLAKFEPLGSLDWITSLGSTFPDFVTGGIGIDSNDDIYVTGSFMGDLYYSETEFLQSSGSYDNFLIKYNVDGAVLNAVNAGKGSKLQLATGLTISENGNIIATGQFMDSITFEGGLTLYASNNTNHLYYCSLNPSDGTANWAKQIQPISTTSSGGIWGIESGTDWLAFTAMFADSIRFEDDTIVSVNHSQDILIYKTDLSGNLLWHRRIGGDEFEYCYNLKKDASNELYFGGYYNSLSLFIDSNDDQTETINSNLGSYDIILGQYTTDGDLEWTQTAGGKNLDKVNRSDIFGGNFYLSGSFSDTLYWGGIQLTTVGPSDQDMFIGSVDVDGNFRSANGFSGDIDAEDSPSIEDGRSVFQNTTNLYSILRSNSKTLILGDSIYYTSGETFSVYLGIVGCLPISVDNTIPTNITGCFGDATGSIQVVASGGFGTPWQYSIDNGLNYSSVAYYQNLPAGDYQVVVIDKEHCTQVGPLITLTQPDSLEVQVVSTEDITKDHDGSIVVVAQGGTSPYTYWLQPDGAPQAYGTFIFVTGDSGKYVVAVDDLNNCGPALTDSLLITEIFDTTGIGTSSGLLVKVYPNPTSGIITIEMPFEDDECEMEVLSMTGQLILKRRVYSSGGVITETLDLSDQAKGLYMLRINGQALRSAIMVK